MMPEDGRGACCFLTADGRCSIHAVRPAECRLTLHGDTALYLGPLHASCAASWGAMQQTLREVVACS